MKITTEVKQPDSTDPKNIATVATVLPAPTVKGQIVAPTKVKPVKTQPAARSTSPAAAPASPSKTKPAARTAKHVTKQKPVASVSAVSPKGKPATKPAAPAAKPASKEKSAAPAKSVKNKEIKKKAKVIRDSFTMPEADYAKLAALKTRCLNAGVAVKKSELLRAGLQLLETLPAKKLLAIVAAIENVKTGRPSKD
jgi:hypothetical protein